MFEEQSQLPIDIHHPGPRVGSPAPDFTLKVSPHDTLSLSDLKGSPSVLVFYPADWSPVCGDQLALYNELMDDFRAQGAKVIAISVDNVWSHQAFRKDREFEFPLLADFNPLGEVAKKYGVFSPEDGTCQRALFVLDKDGIITWKYVSDMGVNPGADGILEALEAQHERH